MYYTEYKPTIVLIEELICFSNLLLRWSHDAPGKLFYKINNNVFLYEIEEIFKTTTGSLLAKMTKNTDNRNKFEYYIDKYEYLFFLKSELESIEKDNAMLTMIPVNIPTTQLDTLCTHDNLGTIASSAINAICVQDEYSFLDAKEIDTLTINGNIHFGTRGKIIPKEKLWPKIPHIQEKSSLDLNKNQLHEKGEEFIAILRSLGQNNIKILAQETKKMYPQLSDPSLGRLISPSGEEKRKPNTYRQRARRALGKVP